MSADWEQKKNNNVGKSKGNQESGQTNRKEESRKGKMQLRAKELLRKGAMQLFPPARRVGDGPNFRLRSRREGRWTGT